LEGSVVTNFLLPAALGVIMFGLGLSLTVADFARVLAMPKAVLIGLFIQTFVLTFVCAGICVLLSLPADLSIGMMLLAAAPGGASANIFSHLAHGDLALNITLTAINSVLALLTLPIIVSIAFWFFMGSEQAVSPPFAKVIEVSLVIIIPVLLGMWVRAKHATFADKAELPVRIFSVAVLTIFSVLALAQNGETLFDHALDVGLACFAFNVVSMAVGYIVPMVMGLDRRQAIAISMEIGIHNAALAIFIAINALGNGVYAIPAAVYSFVMFVTAATFTWWMSRRRGTIVPT
jgi:bile acid:Na+ symporter, BASS family